jgi:prepilin-type N-terminal cleavage/methylation domain-containing protein
MMKKASHGFNLLELMVVLAIVAFLSMLAMPSFTRFFAKAKRTEAYTQLRSLYMAQKIYHAEKGKYTTNLSGADGLGWKAEGNLNYTYGFSQGGEGRSYAMGSLKAPASALAGTYVNGTGFKIGAAADIDADGTNDYLTIDHNGVIAVVVDDLE